MPVQLPDRTSLLWGEALRVRIEQPPEPTFGIGDAVEVLLSDHRWHPATVRAVIMARSGKLALRLARRGKPQDAPIAWRNGELLVSAAAPHLRRAGQSVSGPISSSR